ncbi:reductase AKOR2 [Desarmillaria tabescens]|uniref:Reductase AKOR2 n=1 Tax=Armillaria tabescens TaxID=1929756 RepID=A0AA39KEA0_ARMTA|nr:reductase AKOR2 [Desarmillaria tabescens]KAK0457213.1 reductase AKOR2 [Desarmillaria tabescens]
MTLTLTLNNGISIPMIGMPNSLIMCRISVSPGWRWLATVIQAGYRHIDTAEVYRTEKAVGDAVRESGISRTEFFITTKLSMYHKDRVAESFAKSLDDFGMDYVDLYLMHAPQTVPYEEGNPFPLNPDGTLKTLSSPTFQEAYTEMEKILLSGRAKAIGVSNFSIKTLDELLATATIVPAVNQVEMHPFLAQNDLLEYHRKKGIATEAYSPGGHGILIREEPSLKSLALKYGVSTTQIILAWHISRGVIVLPKSENPQRQKENLSLPNLDKEDIEIIDQLDRGERLIAKLDGKGTWAGWTKEQLGW